MRRKWRHFRRWVGFTLGSFLHDLSRLTDGFRHALRSLGRGIQHSLPFGSRRSGPVPPRPKPRKGPGRLRRPRNWAVFTIVSYWRFWVGLFVATGQAVRWQLKQLTKPREVQPAPAVATPRPTERSLKRLARAVRRFPRALFWWACSCVFLVGRLARASWYGFRAWLRHGHGYTLMRGLPALLVCAAVLWALLMPSFLRLPRSVLYRQRLDTAIRAGDFEEAELCAERLVRETKGNPTYVFAYACILGDKGERGRCLAVMQQLAPPDSPGYGPAHLWLARRLIAQKDPSPESIKEMENRLIWASKQESSAPAARALLLRYYCGTGQPIKAEEQFGVSAATEPEAQMNLALAYAVRGDQDNSFKHAQVVRDLCSAVCKRQPDNAKARLEWAQAAALMGDFPAAVSVLQEGYRLTNAPGYRINLGRFFFNWASSFGNDRAHLVDRVVLLSRSVECDDSNALLIRTLVDQAPIDRPDAKDLRAQIDQLIADKNSPAILQIFLGVDSVLKKDPKEASRRFDLARAANPDSPRILNNIAWTISANPPERLALALSIMETAVAQLPAEQRFLGTRGQILAKLQRWPEAMADLQIAAKVMPENKELQDVMARSYPSSEGQHGYARQRNYQVD